MSFEERRALLKLAGLGALSLVACSGKEEPAVLVGGQTLAPGDIDRDPLALLPRGALALGYLDCASMFASASGAEVGRFLTNMLPIGPESNFVPSRDVARSYGALYAMQGADFCTVLQGTFDEMAIRRSADARAATPSGRPLVKTRYAERDMYVAGQVGFVVLTSHTVLSGNETGMRRALDRLRFDKLERVVPKWMVDLSATPNASFTFAADLEQQPAVQAAAASYAILSGLKVVRVLGNFRPPGLNFVGTLTYDAPTSAVAGAENLRSLARLTNLMSLISSWGFSSVPPVQVQQADRDVGFTMPVDDAFLRLVMKAAADWTTRK